MIGVEECELMFFQNLKQIEQNVGIEDCNNMLNRLAKIMEKCKYFRYFEKFSESRKQKIKEIIESTRLKSKFAGITEMKELYEKGSHYLVELIPHCANLFEREKKLCDIIFADLPSCKYKFINIVTDPFQLLSGMVDKYLEIKTENLTLNEFLLSSDITEALTTNFAKFEELFDVLL